jgi:hypothetical protein
MVDVYARVQRKWKKHQLSTIPVKALSIRETWFGFITEFRITSASLLAI